MPYTSFHARDDGAHERNRNMTSPLVDALTFLALLASFAFVGAMVALAFI